MPRWLLSDVGSPGLSHEFDCRHVQVVVLSVQVRSDLRESFRVRLLPTIASVGSIRDLPIAKAGTGRNDIDVDIEFVEEHLDGPILFHDSLIFETVVQDLKEDLVEVSRAYVFRDVGELGEDVDIAHPSNRHVSWV